MSNLNSHLGEPKAPESDAKIPISLGMAQAGAQVAHRLLNDPEFLAKPNAAGELAARVYRAMVRQLDQKRA